MLLIKFMFNIVTSNIRFFKISEKLYLSEKNVSYTNFLMTFILITYNFTFFSLLVGIYPYMYYVLTILKSLIWKFPILCPHGQKIRA